MAKTDDSFKRPGAVPFSWEIRPGVPKTRPQFHPPSSSSTSIANPRPLSPLDPPPVRHTPPPPSSGFYSPDPLSPSFRSSPRAFSERWLLHRPTRGRPGSGPGCFPTSLFRLKKNWSSGQRKTMPRLDPGYGSDMTETSSPWPVSSRRSISPMWDSPESLFSSNRFSPRVAGEAELVAMTGS